MSPQADAPDVCPRCGGAFACGAAGLSPCACTTLSLSTALQARLRDTFTSCLCLACLREMAAADDCAPPAPAPVPSRG